MILPLMILPALPNKQAAVRLIAENRFLPVSATHHVIHRTFKFNSWIPAHSLPVYPLVYSNAKIIGLTPFRVASCGGGTPSLKTLIYRTDNHIEVL
jgi:hypothetical protein